MLDSNQLFNETYYLDGNLDISIALSNNIISNAFNHFSQFGQFERRNPSAFFDTDYYLRNNGDVAAAVQNNSITAFEHFIEFGQFEKRNPNYLFNTNVYLQQNPDVAAAVQRDELTGIEHFIKYGINEGRTYAQLFNESESEKWQFSLPNYTIIHQGINNLNINVEYTYKDGITYSEYPDFVPIYKNIDQFLVNYPNETDFWEIVNRNLTQKILNENPAMESLTIDIDVLPSISLPYDRSSIVTRTRGGQLEEKWDFKIDQYPIEHQGLNTLNIDVAYTYKQGITTAEYPDFVPIYNQINQFMVNYPNEADFWEIVNKNLTEKIISENPALSDLQITLEILPTDRLPYNRTSTVSRSQPQLLPIAESFLVGNTRDNNVVRFDAKTGNYLGQFIAPGSGGLFSPDSIIFGPDANGDRISDIYITSGDKPGNSTQQGASTVLRYDGRTGAFIDRFVGDDPNTNGVDESGGLLRPYGATFGPDGKFYVSSFLTDQILRYDGTTGKFIDVFATGNQQPGGLNGSNGLLFDRDGNLYVTTQGSIARNGSPDFSAGLPSQVLRYDIRTGQSTVFATPETSPNSLGFVSLLGMQIGPADGNLYVSDFANDIRRYDLKNGNLLSVISTNYTGTSPSSNFIGGITFGRDRNLYTVGFDNRAGANNIGAILGYNVANGAPIASPTNPSVPIFVPPDRTLNRPIGIVSFIPSIEPLRESWSFKLENYPISHQGLNNLNIGVDYVYKPGIKNDEYPDFVPIYKKIDELLVNYPNETDFWEILNRNLTQQILAENPSMHSLTIDLDVLPTASAPYERSSTVTRNRQGQLLESWNFQIPDYPIQHQGLNALNIDVDYNYKQGIMTAEYPNFIPIYNQINQLLVNYPDENQFWEILNRNLTRRILDENPAIDSLVLQLDILPTERLPYNRSSIVTRA